MNETLVPADIMSNQPLQGPDNLFNDSTGDDFADFMNLSTIGNGPITNSGHMNTTKLNRNTASADLEQQLANIQSENTRLRQMVHATKKTHTDAQHGRRPLFHQMNNGRGADISKARISGKRKDPMSMNSAAISGIGQAVEGPSVTRTKRSPGGSQPQLYRQLAREGTTQQRPRLNLSHPATTTGGALARSHGRAFLSAMPVHTPEQRLDPTYVEDQETTESLRSELESTKTELRAALERCEELERRADGNQDPGSDSVDKEERYCMFFDMIFEFIDELCAMLQAQGMELPEGILHIYEKVANGGNPIEQSYIQ
ncbi:hypothetical protein CBER1_10983 [Cercospora berteroae]|uniref:Uncharacterized protein n=1 Tax=Cercospora berteroae TaxID=357750 RepID=A0A2S6BXH1_9PEZI|nr:hypothetical protein CBER1_10983 [Cercospora berteroae]